MWSLRNITQTLSSKRIQYGLGWWIAGTIPVLFGVCFGHFFLVRQFHPLQQPDGLLYAFLPWDGVWYEKIVESGYDYNPSLPSSVAFFPGFPAVASIVKLMTGMPGAVSLLLVSQLSLIGCFVVLDVYLHDRVPDPKPIDINNVRRSALATVALAPITFWWHFAYSESLFLLTLIVAFALMARRADVFWVALTVGFATAVRPTGIALLPPLIMYARESSASLRSTISTLTFVLPISLWGLLAYMLFQWVEFGTAFAFVETQSLWARQPPLSGIDKLASLISLEPIWSVYVPNCEAFWSNYETPPANPCFSMFFANPLYFLGTSVLLFVGWKLRWLSSREVVLGVGLLLIPYITQSHETMMQSQARYASVVFPVFIVLAHIYVRSPRIIQIVSILISTCLLFAYSALFSSWYRLC